MTQRRQSPETIITANVTSFLLNIKLQSMLSNAQICPRGYRFKSADCCGPITVQDLYQNFRLLCACLYALDHSLHREVSFTKLNEKRTKSHDSLLVAGRYVWLDDDGDLQACENMHCPRHSLMES